MGKLTYSQLENGSIQVFLGGVEQTVIGQAEIVKYFESKDEILDVACAQLSEARKTIENLREEIAKKESIISHADILIDKYVGGKSNGDEK